MKQFIFLDIDGVLNSDDWYNSDENQENLYGNEADLDPQKIELINTLSQKTGAYIIISSDWKYEWEDTLDRLKNAGLTAPIIGSTPAVEDSHRGKEIALWFKYHINDKDQYINYIIIDDRDDVLNYQEDKLIQTNHKTGFTEKDLTKALMMLTVIN